MMDEKQIESLKRRYGSRIADAPKRRRGPERMAVMKGGKPKAGSQTMLRLLSYLKRDRMAMTAAFFCVILGTVTNLAGAYMLRPIINRYIVPLDGSRGDVAGLFRSLCVMGPVMNNLSQLNYGLTACIGGLLCVFRNFDVGGLTVFLGFSRQFSRPINELSMQVGNVFSALAGAERVFAVLDAEPEAADAPDAVSIAPIRGEVVLDHVTFGYEPGQVILKDISLYAKPGQKIAFVGSTGAGKTTITNLINRFYDIQGGSITVDGVDVRRMHRKELRENIAMVLQDTHLFTGTVRENIRYGRLDATDEEVVEAAKTASAHSFIMRLPDGYDTMLEGDGANLSQGQRQLLNIARAAVSKAPILILDEATSSVDTRTEKHIEHGMDRLMADRTTFVIAHRLSTVRNANAIMVLEHGQIIERGDHEDLLAQKGRYFELYTGMKELE